MAEYDQQSERQQYFRRQAGQLRQQDQSRSYRSDHFEYEEPELGVEGKREIDDSEFHRDEEKSSLKEPAAGGTVALEGWHAGDAGIGAAFHRECSGDAG